MCFRDEPRTESWERACLFSDLEALQEAGNPQMRNGSYAALLISPAKNQCAMKSAGLVVHDGCRLFPVSGGHCWMPLTQGFGPPNGQKTVVFGSLPRQAPRRKQSCFGSFRATKRPKSRCCLSSSTRGTAEETNRNLHLVRNLFHLCSDRLQILQGRFCCMPKARSVRKPQLRLSIANSIRTFEQHHDRPWKDICHKSRPEYPTGVCMVACITEWGHSQILGKVVKFSCS